MNAAGYVLLSALLPSLPSCYRASWAAQLVSCEPHPPAVRQAREILQRAGLLDGGSLTPDGVQAARDALHAWLTPPRLYK